jgi:hypothetical protein
LSSRRSGAQRADPGQFAESGDALLSRFAWAGGHADVWRWFDDSETLRAVAAALVSPFRDDATKVAGIESRRFILGAACALELPRAADDQRGGGACQAGRHEALA